MASLPSGARISVATAFATEKAITAVSNAAEAVCTSTAHGLNVGDIVIIKSGWGRLNKMPFRVKTVPTADTFTLEGKKANTSNTSLFTPGGGTGSFRKATTWVDIVQVLATNSSGGEPKQVTFKYLEDESEQQLNNGFTPVSRTFDLDADSIDTPGYDAALDLTQVQTETIMRTMLKSGAVSYLVCKLALNDEVVMQDDQVNRVRLDVSGSARSVRYAS